MRPVNPTAHPTLSSPGLERSSGAPTLRGLSSMATRLVLTELAQAWGERGAGRVVFESIGGVEAAQRVAAGEAVDVVVLARDAIERLMTAGHLLPGSAVDLVRSPVAAAVPAGVPVPDMHDVAAVREAILAARRIGYSTGPSGQALAQWLQRWGIAEAMRDRVVVPPPGIPVGSLLARGEIDLAFQQLSELLPIPGIQVVPDLPPELGLETVFTGAVARVSTQPGGARALLEFLASPAADAAKLRQGMRPARTNAS